MLDSERLKNGEIIIEESEKFVSVRFYCRSGNVIGDYIDEKKNIKNRNELLDRVECFRKKLDERYEK